MSHLTLLLDENLPVATEFALQRRGAGQIVLRVGGAGAPPKGTTDPELLSWYEKTDVVLVTLDRRTMQDHFGEHLAAGGHSADVFLLKRGAPMTQVIEDLLLVLGASTPADWRDRLVCLPL